MALFQSSITRQTQTTSPSFATKPNQNTQPAPHSQTNRTKTHNQPLIRKQTEPKHTTSPFCQLSYGFLKSKLWLMHHNQISLRERIED